MNAPLELNEDWLHRLQAFFRRVGREMPQTNRIQAMIPRGATMIDNSAGTAAGIRAEVGAGCRVFVMPGVPKEMKIMFERSVLPELGRDGGTGVILSKTLHTFGLGESSVAEKLGALMKRDRNPSVGTTVSQGIVSLRINARFETREAAQRELDATMAECAAALGDLTYGADHDTLASVVGNLLKKSNETVATAESCTGGLLAKYLTDIPGSSSYFKYGWVTYANEAKQSQLDVPASVLAEHGAVSEPVVIAMAQHAREKSGADYALAISGIAGPDGGTPAKPVGTVCIALASNSGLNTQHSEPFSRTFHLTGDREMIRDRSAKMALTILRFHLLGKPLPF
jgi:nicotinamide-nucleotide amidase